MNTLARWLLWLFACGYMETSDDRHPRLPFCLAQPAFRPPGARDHGLRKEALWCLCFCCFSVSVLTTSPGGEGGGGGAGRLPGLAQAQLPQILLPPCSLGHTCQNGSGSKAFPALGVFFLVVKEWKLRRKRPLMSS